MTYKRKEYLKKYREEHKEKAKQSMKKWYNENKEKHNARCRKYYRENKWRWEDYSVTQIIKGATND